MSNKLATNWVLASASKHRRKQLELAGCEVLSQAADIDESPIDGETPKQRAARLAMAKALKVRETYPDRLIIGSDQVAHLNNTLLRKPGNHQDALNQLCRSAGQSVFFETALTVVFGSHQLTELITTEIEFWPFDRTQADRYLKLEQPYDAAGSFYSEAMGQWLIKRHKSEDPSAIVGLPMLALNSCLRQLGINPLDQ